MTDDAPPSIDMLALAAERAARPPAERAAEFASAFRDNANGIALQFGGRLYLVGSMLWSALPGDVDLRLAISREDLDAWFGRDAAGDRGYTSGRFYREREELKQSLRLTRRWRRWPAPRFDFQFLVSLFGDGGEPVWGDRPRLRLDAVPEEFLAAGRGDP